MIPNKISQVTDSDFTDFWGLKVQRNEYGKLYNLQLVQILKVACENIQCSSYIQIVNWIKSYYFFIICFL